MIMKGFPESGELTMEQQHFNSILSSARMVVKGALGRLKGGFCCLVNRNDTIFKYLPFKIAACCVLQNICETRDDFQEAGECEVHVNDDHENESTGSAATPADTTAQEIRQALTLLINERV